MMRIPLPSFVLLLGALFLASCASVSVQDAHEISTTPIKMPEKIYVQKFSMDGAKVEIDKQGKELEEYKQAVVDLLHTRLVDRLPELPLLKNTRVAPCRRRVG
jgi:PBP1b-binding outer membrane lipoprotein LpoB